MVIFNVIFNRKVEQSQRLPLGCCSFTMLCLWGQLLGGPLGSSPPFFYQCLYTNGDGSKPCTPGEHQIAGKWMFIPLKMVLIGIDPYTNLKL